MVSQSQAKIVNRSILILGSASGLLVSNPKLFYSGFLQLFSTILPLIFVLSSLMYIMCKKFGKRILYQTEERPNFSFELKESFFSLWTLVIIMSWPLYQYNRGKLNGLVWNLEESTAGSSIFLNGLIILGEVLFADFYQYWKHYILHHKQLFIFHKGHHKLHDPTPYGAFAINPFESFLTFLPIGLQAIPSDSIKLYLPIHLIVAISCFILTLYLHAGYTIEWVEKLLSLFYINTSRFHNIHHQNANKHFGEVLTLWDVLRGTGTITNNITNQKQKIN